MPRYVCKKRNSMKKFLEVLVDDNGDLHLSTDYKFHDSVENPVTDIKLAKKEEDANHRKLIRGLVNALWKERNYNVSKAIRYLSMTEIMACAEPYQQAEEFWYTMMFDYIPYYESFATGLKIPFGYDPTIIVRPITGVFPNGLCMSDIGKPKN